jgi:hypothetical protein
MLQMIQQNASPLWHYCSCHRSLSPDDQCAHAITSEEVLIRMLEGVTSDAIVRNSELYLGTVEDSESCRPTGLRPSAALHCHLAQNALPHKQYII